MYEHATRSLERGAEQLLHSILTYRNPSYFIRSCFALRRSAFMRYPSALSVGDFKRQVYPGMGGAVKVVVPSQGMNPDTPEPDEVSFDAAELAAMDTLDRAGELPPRPMPGGEGDKKKARQRIPKEKKLKAARKFGGTIQAGIDKANTLAVRSGTGLSIDFSELPHESIPVDFRPGKDRLEFIYANNVGEAIAYHAQEFGLDKVESLLKLLDENPRAVAAVGIVAALVVNALHVKQVTTIAIREQLAREEAKAAASAEEGKPNAE